MFGRQGIAFFVVGDLCAVIGGVLLLTGVTTAGTVLLIIAATFVLIGAGLMVAQRTLLGPTAKIRRVMAEGMLHQGRLVAMRSSASRVGANPVMHLTVEVGGAEHQLRSVVPIHRLAQLRPGDPVPVRWLIDEPDFVVVDWGE
jgi:hypothetical protein